MNQYLFLPCVSQASGAFAEDIPLPTSNPYCLKLQGLRALDPAPRSAALIIRVARAIHFSKQSLPSGVSQGLPPPGPEVGPLGSVVPGRPHVRGSVGTFRPVELVSMLQVVLNRQSS